jgi:hypothetical protein
MVIPHLVAIGAIGTVEAVQTTLAKRRDKLEAFQLVKQHREKEFKGLVESSVWERIISASAYYSQPKQTVSCFELDGNTVICFIRKRIPEN